MTEIKHTGPIGLKIALLLLFLLPICLRLFCRTLQTCHLLYAKVPATTDDKLALDNVVEAPHEA